MQAGTRTPPPPPPEPGGRLTWYNSTSRPHRPLPRHPLLLLAEPAPARRVVGPAGPLGLWRGVSTALRSRRPGMLRQHVGEDLAVATLGAPTPGPDPLVVAVVGGKGAIGGSALALNCAWAFGRRQSPARALLVDGDWASPDLDLLLGGCRAGHDLAPLARLDQLVLHLAELCEGAANLDSYLFTAQALDFQCLFAALRDRRSAPVGREHLDYLFQRVLQPAFRVIVVDLGRCLSPESVIQRFWLEKASAALIPTGPGESQRRSCVRTVTFVEQNSALTRGGCLAVAHAKSGWQELREELAREGIEVMGMPWAPGAAQVAEARRVPMAVVDRRMRAASFALAEQLTRLGSGVGGHGS